MVHSADRQMPLSASERAPAIGGDRAVGSFERFFWLINQDRASHLACAAHIEGPTTVDAWIAALRALQARHPLLSASIEPGAEGTVNFRHVADAPIPFRVVRADAASSWEAELAQEMGTPIDARSAPLARAVLVHGADRSVLIFVSHHAIGDGLAVAFAVRDLLQALSGQALEELPMPQSTDQLLELIAPAAVPASADAAAPSDPPPIVPGVYRSEPPSAPTVDSRRLSAELTTRLQRRARREGTTVHAALIAAMTLAARSIAGNWGERNVTVISPVDIRQLLRVTDDYALRVSAGLTFVEPHAGASFWELARSAKSSLAGVKTYEGTAPLIGAIQATLGTVVDAPAASQFASFAFPYDIMVTNLGALPIETRFGALKLDAFWGPSFLIGFQGEQSVGVATANGALTLLHTSHTPIPALLETAERMLSAASVDG